MRSTVIRSSISAAIAGFLLTTAVANAAPIQWSSVDGGNDHYYEWFETPVTWDEAKTLAESLTHLGHTGYLATVTSAGENSFLESNFGNGGWLGGNDVDTEGLWKWMTGPEMGMALVYSAWADGEPNNWRDEDYLDSGGGSWNDVDPDPFGYYVEYGGMSAAPVPEPGTLLLLGSGAAGMWMRRRRQLAQR